MSTSIEGILSDAADAEKTKTIADALNVLRSGASKYPRNDRIQFQLGRLSELAKGHANALSHYQRAAEGKAELPPDVALGMARCYLNLKKIDRAQKLFEALDKKAPGKNKDIVLGLAGCARLGKDFDKAKGLIQRTLAIDPNFMPAKHELAVVLLETDPKDEGGSALQALEFNIRREDLYGDSLDVWMKLLKETNREKYLQDELEALAKRFPKKVEFVFAYGVACNRAGEISLARPALEKANEMLPNSSKILYELGLVERVSGNIELSQDYVRRSLELRPDHPAGLRTYGVDHKYVYGDDQFKRLNLVGTRMTEMSKDDQVQMHFAYGKALDDLGELDASFAHYGLGGNKKRSEEQYDERSTARLFQLLQKILNKERMETPRPAGFLSDSPVFILGMPRSGTSLMEQILSSHPDIFGAGELKIMTTVLENIEIGQARLRMGGVQAAFAYEQNASFSERGQRYVEQVNRLIPEGSSYKRIVDKMPGNFNFVGLIHMILPNAKIIHSRRHPVETCLSCYRIHFAEGHPWTYNLRELGRYYRFYWNLMKHWREVLPGVMLEVRYEENVADVEGAAKGLIDYLGLEWDENCLNFYNTDRPVKTASASQVRKPIYKTSTNRWRKYEKYLGPLLDEIGDIVVEYESEISHLIER